MSLFQVENHTSHPLYSFKPARINEILYLFKSKLNKTNSDEHQTTVGILVGMTAGESWSSENKTALSHCTSKESTHSLDSHELCVLYLWLVQVGITRDANQWHWRSLYDWRRSVASDTQDFSEWHRTLHLHRCQLCWISETRHPSPSTGASLRSLDSKSVNSYPRSTCFLPLL